MLTYWHNFNLACGLIGDWVKALSPYINNQLTGCRSRKLNGAIGQDVTVLCKKPPRGIEAHSCWLFILVGLLGEENVAVIRSSGPAFT